jgi:hypothetical protein
MDDDWRNFFRGNKQHLLYFWHVMDTCDLLLNTLTVLPNVFSASTDGIPSTQQQPGDTPSISNNKNEHARNSKPKIRTLSDMSLNLLDILHWLKGTYPYDLLWKRKWKHTLWLIVSIQHMVLGKRLLINKGLDDLSRVVFHVVHWR